MKFVLKELTSFSGFNFSLEIEESSPSASLRFIDLSSIEGVRAGLGLPELRSAGVL